MCAVAVRGGFDRQVEPSRLRSHLGYLVTTVVSLHVVGYCMLITRPTPSAPPGLRSAIHLRLIPAHAKIAQAAGLGYPETGAAPELGDAGVAMNALGGLAGVSVTQQSGGGGSVGQASLVQGVIVVEPAADEILGRAEVPQLPDDQAMLADLRDQTEQVSPGWSTDGANEYLPRSALTQGPQTQTPVIIEFPQQIGQAGHFTTVLALFIDETGVVRRIRIDGTVLPEPLLEAAKRGFLSARFRPGQLNGQAVKSLIRVEVVFDNTPLDTDHGVKSLNFSL